MAQQSFKVEGLRELNKMFDSLPKSLGKAALRRSLIRQAQPIAADASSRATEKTGALAKSATVSTVLSARQRKLHRKMFRDDRAAVEVFVGFGPDPAAHLEEFGSVHNKPKSMMRKAWANGAMKLLEGFKADLWAEILKTVKRYDRREARKAEKIVAENNGR